MARDAYIRYRYLSDGRMVEAQCSAAHRQIAAGLAEPLDDVHRATYVTWCKESGHDVAEHVPAPVAEYGGGAVDVDEADVEPSAPGQKADDEPELIPAEFPHAKELAAVGIVTFDKIPADLTVTRVKGIGKAGAGLVARALAARAVG
jgi:hypothetical protein